MSLAETISLPPRISSTEGVNGQIKTLPRDFVVSEIIENGLVLSPFSNSFNLPGKKGLFLHFVLIKNNIDTERALSWIAKIWKLERNNFSIAGTKDKRAITAQRVSVWGAREKFENGEIKEIDYPTFKTKSLCLRLKDIRLGELWGNHFDISVRNIDKDKTKIKEEVEKTLSIINTNSGVINAFGPQRFGEIRPLTHIIGKFLLQNNVKEAVKWYIGKTFHEEEENTKLAREFYWKTNDPKKSIELFPTHLKNELILLKSLASYSTDYFRAFKHLSLHLQKLFVHAYQAYLFNKYLKIRYNEFSRNFSEPLTGEKTMNGKVAAPIVGYKTELTGETATIYKTIFQEEGIVFDDFNSKIFQKLGGYGSYRTLLFEPRKIKYEILSDDINNGKNMLNISFSLPKGTYATVFLREITNRT